MSSMELEVKVLNINEEELVNKIKELLNKIGYNPKDIIIAVPLTPGIIIVAASIIPTII